MSTWRNRRARIGTERPVGTTVRNALRLPEPRFVNGALEFPPITQEPLVTAPARAFHWQELIDSGKYASISDLSRALGLDRSYVSRIMRLTLLAPDIVDAIVDGREPSGLSLEMLVKGMLVVWAAQRQLFGFDEPSSIDHRTEQLVDYEV